MTLRISHDAWIVVCDGRKALFLRNEGDKPFPNLKVDQVIEAPANAHTAEQGTDRPGRLQNQAGAPTSAVEETDWHTLGERRFAQEVAGVIEALDAGEGRRTLVLVAPPKTLAVLRHSLSEAARADVVAEIDKDLTKHPVYEIERLLTGE